MRKKIFNLSANPFLGRAFSWPLALVLGPTLMSFGSEVAWGNAREIPGLPIARLALPSIPVNPDIGTPTGTFVGEKVIDLKKKIQNIEGLANSLILSIRDQYEQAILEVNEYHHILSEIEAKLQLGTTPSNPKLIEMRNIALQQLDDIADTIGTMNGLAARFSESSEQTRILSSQIEGALHMPGAVDEDHAHLILMSDELLTVKEAISQSLEILNANASRQSEWLSTERVHLANLSSSIDKGKLHVPPHGEALKYPMPIVLPDLSPLHIDPSQKKQDKIQLKSKSLRDKLRSETLPMATIHQEVLQEIAQSPKQETAPLALDIVSQTYEDIPQVPPHEAPPPAPLIPVPEAHENVIHETAHETPTSASASLVSAPETHEEVNQEVAQTSDAEATSPQPIPALSQAPIEQGLPVISVAPHPKVQPLPNEKIIRSEEETTPQAHPEQSTPAEKLISYTMAAKERPPLVSLGSNQEIWSQKWVLVSSAKRGLKTSPSGLEIVNVVGENGSSNRGEEVKSLLIKMGLKPEHLRVINVKGEGNQEADQVYIFGGK